MRSGGYARSPSTALRIDSVTKQSDTKCHSERSEETQWGIPSRLLHFVRNDRSSRIALKSLR